MTPQTDAFDALALHMERIVELMNRADEARRLPDRYHRQASVIRLTGDSYSGWNGVDKNTGERAQKALGAFVASERQRGERERDERLADCAAELDALRNSLQPLVGPAIVALGNTARKMRNG